MTRQKIMAMAKSKKTPPRQISNEELAVPVMSGAIEPYDADPFAPKKVLTVPSRMNDDEDIPF
jgi:hypothetical protein